MKFTQTMIVVIPVAILLTACGSKPDPSSITRSQTTPIVENADQNNNSASSQQGTNDNSQKVNVAELQAQQVALEEQKSKLLGQQEEIARQKAGFAKPGDLKGVAFGDFMTNAQALPAIDQAALADIIQAAMDMDIDALQKAIQDLIADLQAAIADLQAQIDVLKVQIAAAQP